MPEKKNESKAKVRGPSHRWLRTEALPCVADYQARNSSGSTLPAEISEKSKRHQKLSSPIAINSQDLQSRASSTPFPLSESVFEAEA